MTKEEIPRTGAAPTPGPENGASWPGFSWHRHLRSLDYSHLANGIPWLLSTCLVSWDILPMPVPASSRKWLSSPFTSQSISSRLNKYRFRVIIRLLPPRHSSLLTDRSPRTKVISRQCFNSGSRLGFITMTWPWHFHLPLSQFPQL